MFYGVIRGELVTLLLEKRCGQKGLGFLLTLFSGSFLLFSLSILIYINIF